MRLPPECVHLVYIARKECVDKAILLLVADYQACF